MVIQRNNYAFIDGQNLYLGIRRLGWRLDFKRFRIYLREKYGVTKAFMFVGYLSSNKKIYDFLRKAGYLLVFKPIVSYKRNTIKGNCDADLVLYAVDEVKNYNKALIVSGDGDFYCLAKYLIAKNKLCKVLIPDNGHYSVLLKQISHEGINYLVFLNNLRDEFEYKKPA
ncbi:MAG: NYN domain-containing protein [bacterium]